MSSAVSSQVAASGGGLAGAAAVTIASAGVSAIRGVGDINELKDYLLSGIESAASSVYMKLPDFKALLCYSCRGITDFEIMRKIIYILFKVLKYKIQFNPN